MVFVMQDSVELQMTLQSSPSGHVTSPMADGLTTIVFIPCDRLIRAYMVNIMWYKQCVFIR